MNAFKPTTNNTAPIVHLVRHGRIPNYQTDQPLTAHGRQEALAVGQELARHIRAGETINFFSSPTRRTRQTAELLADGLNNALTEMNLNVNVAPVVVVDDRLQNLQFYLDGLSYDPIRPLFEVAQWRLHQTPSPRYEAYVAFYAKFWSNPDPMAYWLTHPSEAIETPKSVAKRTHAYIAERLTCMKADGNPWRTICVTHSANLRAFLQAIFGGGPGEPPFCGMATISEDQVYYQGQVGQFNMPPFNLGIIQD